METPANQRERYTHSQSSAATQVLARRKAASHAAFFLPHLRSGMSLLDCGCGPGSITLDMAAIVAPGKVVGIDIAEDQLEHARAGAAGLSLANVRFEAATAYDLPFPDNSFDAVFTHAVVEHLREPGRALAAMRRVLKSGGVLGIRDADRGGEVLWPPNPAIERIFAVWNQLLQYNGADPFIGRRLRSLLNEAGFVRVEASAAYECHGTPETVELAAASASHYFASSFADQVVGLGWMDPAEIEAARSAWQDWGRSPDAFWARTWCEAVGWKE